MPFRGTYDSSGLETGISDLQCCVSRCQLPGDKSVLIIRTCIMRWTEANSRFSARPCMWQGSAGASEGSFVSHALLPESTTPDLLDYSLAWHLHSTLAAAGLWRSPASLDQVRAKPCGSSSSSVASRPATCWRLAVLCLQPPSAHCPRVRQMPALGVVALMFGLQHNASWPHLSLSVLHPHTMSHTGRSRRVAVRRQRL